MAGILGDDADTPPPEQPQGPQAPPMPPQAQAPGLPNMGVWDRLQANYAPGAYRARVGAYQQNLALQAQQAAYEGINAKMGPGHEAEARMLSLNPNLATEMMKPQIVPRGASLVGSMGAGGGGAGGAGGAASGGAPGVYTNTEGDLQGEGLKQLVERSLTGEDVTGEVGRDPVNRAKYLNLLGDTMKERGITAAQLTDRNAKYPAYKSAINDLTKAQAEKGIGAQEFAAYAPHLQQSAAQVNTLYPNWNAFQQAIKTGTGSPAATVLQQQINGVIAAYGRATGDKEGAKAHVEDVLNKNWNGGQIAAGIQTLQQEIQATQSAYPKEMNRLKAQHGLADKATTGTLANAKAAIAKGIPRDQVIQKIEEAGFSAEGL